MPNKFLTSCLRGLNSWFQETQDFRHEKLVNDFKKIFKVIIIFFFTWEFWCLMVMQNFGATVWKKLENLKVAIGQNRFSHGHAKFYHDYANWTKNVGCYCKA